MFKSSVALGHQCAAQWIGREFKYRNFIILDEFLRRKSSYSKVLVVFLMSSGNNRADEHVLHLSYFRRWAQGRNTIGYCGLTTNFPSVSQSCIRKSPIASSLALLTSPAQLCLASRLIVARLHPEFFKAKSVKYLTYSFFSSTQNP